MNIRHITSAADPAAEVFFSLTEQQLRNRLDPQRGLFIAESPKVIRTALEAGYEPVKLLCEERHIEGDAREVIGMAGGVEVLTGERSVLEAMTGYRLTRGVLCAMRRKPSPALEDTCRKAKNVCVIHGVTDTTNIGAIFRSAAALGVDAVVLSEDSCDPLNRRAVRVSMGTVFLVPWTWSHDPVGELRALGFATLAMALDDNSLPLDAPELKRPERKAVVMGTEGDGLPKATIAGCDYTVKIPMWHGVDSLNVAAASAVAFWELFRR